MADAVIVGADGQDGRLLREALEADGARVVGLDKGGRRDVARYGDVEKLIRSLRPREVYYLAARHQPAEGRSPDPLEELANCWRVHALGVFHFLEAIRRRAPRTRLFYASSCRVFGRPARKMQDEATPIDPDDLYGVTKAAGTFLCRMYRRRGVFASVGLLFNHESPLRRPRFVTRRITRGLLDVRAGRRRRLELGDLSAAADWGWAPDFVDAMRRILALPEPGDFVIATGRRRTVGDFVRAAAGAAGVDWRRAVREDKSLLAEPRPAYLGDASRLRRATGWRPTVGFREMVERLLRAEEAR